MLESEEDQIKREDIPDPATIKIGYRPYGNLVMVKMLPDVKQIGKIFLPENNSIRTDACEGHVMFKGPKVSENVNQGDVIAFEKNMANGFDIDQESFYLVPESAIVLQMTKESLIHSRELRAQRQNKP